MPRLVCSPMLYSLTANLAFAHYPKTAGSAIAEWFRGSFPDARYVKPGHPHVDVRRSLAWLSGGASLPPLARLRYLSRASNWRLAIEPRPELPATIRIIGVVREPLEMLGSLYGYWRRGEANPNPREAGLARACREFGLDVAVDLPRKNCGTARHREVMLSSPAEDSLRHHFAWYHDTFGHADHPAARRRPAAKLAA